MTIAVTVSTADFPKVTGSDIRDRKGYRIMLDDSERKRLLQAELDALSPEEQAYLKTPEGRASLFLVHIEKNGLSESDYENFVVSDSLYNGDTEPLIFVLREGKASLLNERTWVTHADYLEGKLPKKTGPKNIHSRFMRDLDIYVKFFNLQNKHGYEEAIVLLENDDSVCIGRKAIEKIVTKFNKTGQALKTAHSKLYPRVISPLQIKRNE